MAIIPLPSNPFNVLKSYFYLMYLKINELIVAVNTGTGSSTQLVHTYTAGANLSGQRVVIVSGGKAVYYDATDEAQIGLQLGMTDQAAITNDPVIIVSAGVIVNPGWGLTPNAIYYASINGLISTAIPVLPSTVQKIGVAIDADTLKLNFSEPIYSI